MGRYNNALSICHWLQMDKNTSTTTKQRVPVQTYSSGDAQDYLTWRGHFERVAQANGWSDEEAIQQIQKATRHMASLMVNGINREVQYWEGPQRTMEHLLDRYQAEFTAGMVMSERVTNHRPYNVAWPHRQSRGIWPDPHHIHRQTQTDNHHPDPWQRKHQAPHCYPVDAHMNWVWRKIPITHPVATETSQMWTTLPRNYPQSTRMMPMTPCQPTPTTQELRQWRKPKGIPKTRRTNQIKPTKTSPNPQLPKPTPPSTSRIQQIPQPQPVPSPAPQPVPPPTLQVKREDHNLPPTPQPQPVPSPAPQPIPPPTLQLEREDHNLPVVLRLRRCQQNLAQLKVMRDRELQALEAERSDWEHSTRLDGDVLTSLFRHIAVGRARKTHYRTVAVATPPVPTSGPSNPEHRSADTTPPRPFESRNWSSSQQEASSASTDTSDTEDSETVEPTHTRGALHPHRD